MKFEIGQDRLEVHLLVAYIDAISFPSRFSEFLRFKCPEFIIKVFKKKYAILYSVDDINKLFLHIEDKTIKKPDIFYKKIKIKFNTDYKKAIRLLNINSKDKEKYTNFKNIIKSVKLLTIYMPILRYFEVVAT